MKYDCFTFLNELDLLELRMEYLASSVDYFVIVESNLTFSGNEKPYFFDKAKERFAKWSEKIIYLALEQSLDGFPEERYGNLGNLAWILEYQQRNAIAEAIDVTSEDQIFIGDIDEIPDKRALKKADTFTEPVSFMMSLHYYYMNCKSTGREKYWNGTACVRGDYFNKYTPQQIRNDRDHFLKIERSGWHFSYLGGIERIKYKVRSFAHTEYNTNRYLNDDNLTNALKAGTDVFNRTDMKFDRVPLFFYPTDMRDCMKRKPHLLEEITVLKWCWGLVRSFFH